MQIVKDNIEYVVMLIGIIAALSFAFYVVEDKVIPVEETKIYFETTVKETYGETPALEGIDLGTEYALEAIEPVDDYVYEYILDTSIETELPPLQG